MIEFSKNTTCKKDFYLEVSNALKLKTNLSTIQENLHISKQQLNYYIRKLKENGLIIKKGKGWYEVIESSKNVTKYGSNLPKDFIRGHAYIWEIKLPKEIKGWNNRIEILKKNNINYKLVGAKLNTPRIKILGRKIWLCNKNLRIFESKDTSYYGINAIEGRKQAFRGLLEVINGIEHKLGILLKPLEFSVKREHYSLIKNDLAIDCNKKGVILRISDEKGEWLLVDDSLEKGGELENIGKESLITNVPMQKWWNEHKELNFRVTPKFILNGFAKTQEFINQAQSQLLEYRKENREHLKLIRSWKRENEQWRKQSGYKEINKYQKILGDFIK